MNIERTSHTVLEQAANVISQHGIKESTKVFEEIQEIIEGRKVANRDHKRVLCAEMNRWMEYYGNFVASQTLSPFTTEELGNFNYYYLDGEGNITLAPKELPEWMPTVPDADQT